MTKTINGLTVTTSAAAGDFIPIWRASNADTRKITKANLLGFSATGGGTLATGGFTLTVSGTSTINGSLVGNISGGGTLATGGFTLTVPATGTAALLSGTQTLTGAKTFSALLTASAGINLGGTTLDDYRENTWTPADGSGAGLSYSVAAGRFTRIGRMVWAGWNVTWPSTANGNNAAISLSNIGQGAPLSLGTTTAAGGIIFVNGYAGTAHVIPRVITDETITFFTSAGVAITNANLSTLTLRGWIFYDV